MADDVYARLKALGIVLPKAPPPAANYVPTVLHRGTLYVAGQGPMEADGNPHTGIVGAGVSVAEARAHARLTAINILAQIHAALGDLNRIERMLRAQGRELPKAQRILELNLEHPLLKNLQKLEDASPGSERVQEWMRLVYDQALLAEGSPIDDPAAFAKWLTKLFTEASEKEAVG